ncbi:hypothetical protein [Stenotrophomonas geniculata]|uniref:hypothetical protein n=1 Tax=Stenotrophomonas geniculata TaxID=86188 RepID=UPI002478E38E|nr:hypothetical protein [Stenotrophomonas geniculata]MDH7551838.1 hypothetical protein [Stenotrophomonas geniculata]
MTVYKIINPSDPYHLTADDLVLAAIAACLLGHGKYALEATDGSEGVPLFLFGGHDEWFAAQGAGSFDAALTAATGQRAEALAEVLESVTIVGTRSSLNDIGEAAARLAVGVRRMVAQAHERTPYDAMGPVDAPNPPAVRASLADVQPGGMVRLGDALPPLPKMQRFTNLYGETYAYSAEQMHNYARAALSAQPSPGGQGDAQTIEKLRAMMDHSFGGPGFVVYGTAQSIAEVERRLAPGIAARQPVGDQHPDDVAVDAFAATMKAKMAEARAKGRGGWEDPTQCSADDLTRMLRDHVEKGDPRDVANFCMMLHQRGEAIAARQPVGEPAMYQVRPRSFEDGEGWRKVTKREYDDRGPFPGYDETEWERRTLYAAPPAQVVDLDELRRAVCVVNVVGQIDGHDVVRRNSLLDVIDNRRQRLTESQAVQP